MRRFLEAEERYARVGRALKLCLLFVGPPGSTKSSLVRALALAHRRDVYSLSLSGLRDAECNELVASIGPQTILLIEDFDLLGFSHAPNRKRGRVIAAIRNGHLDAARRLLSAGVRADRAAVSAAIDAGGAALARDVLQFSPYVDSEECAELKRRIKSLSSRGRDVGPSLVAERPSRRARKSPRHA